MKYKIGFVLVLIITQLVSASDSSKSRWVEKNHVVKDTALNLMWQDTQSVKIRKKTWNDANHYCESLILGQHKNWRLPTLDELLTTVDYTRSSPALIEDFSYSDNKGYYWSSSRVSTDVRYAWYVAIDKGNTYAYSKEETAFMRCVRNDK